jgi:predicted TIM-barrel fold metal-dependent hydrolase
MNIGAIDVHHHILPPNYLATIGDRLPPQGLFGSPPIWNPKVSIEAMDRNGIRAAITSIAAPGVWFGDIAEAVGLARGCNEYAAQMARDYPGRFGLFATLPLPAIDESLREIEYAVNVLGAAGVVLMTNYDGRYLGEFEFHPVFEELQRRRMAVFVHPTAGPYKNPLPAIPVPSLEFPFETTRTITSLLYGGTLARCRGVNFIFSHAGGAVPFLAQRIGRLTVRPEFARAVPDGVLSELGRLYFDIALSANPFAFDPLLRLVSISNVMFGSDYPHAGEPTLIATLKGLDELGLNPSDVRAVKESNATALFGQFLRKAA